MVIQELALLSGAIAVGFLLAVAYYESLCYRDVLVARTMRLAHRVSKRRAVHGVAYLLAVGVGIPVLLLVWVNVLEASLLVIGSKDRVGSVALISTAVVAATRILTYIREKTAHELAKAIPLSFAIILLTGGSVNLQANVAALSERPESADVTVEMVLFLLGVELGLRALTDGSHALLAAIRRRTGSESDAGIWRTLGSIVRRPMGTATDAPPGPAGDAGPTA